MLDDHNFIGFAIGMQRLIGGVEDSICLRSQHSGVAAELGLQCSTCFILELLKRIHVWVVFG